MEVARYDSTELKEFCEGVFVSLGMTREDAEVAADSLVRANLEGTESHGVSRLAIYARRIKEGRISAKPDIRVERTGSVLRVDGGNGLGQVASYHALLAAIPVAKETGGTTTTSERPPITARWLVEKAWPLSSCPTRRRVSLRGEEGVPTSALTQ